MTIAVPFDKPDDRPTSRARPSLARNVGTVRGRGSIVNRGIVVPDVHYKDIVLGAWAPNIYPGFPLPYVVMAKVLYLEIDIEYN